MAYCLRLVMLLGTSHYMQLVTEVAHIDAERHLMISETSA